MNSLIKWGALAVEIFLLLVLFSFISICGFSLNFKNIGQISLLIIGAGACAYLSYSHSNHSQPRTPFKMKQMLLEPPIAIWILGLVLFLTGLTNNKNCEYIYLYKTK